MVHRTILEKEIEMKKRIGMFLAVAMAAI